MIGFLYGQTEYNILKSALKITEYVKSSKEIGYKFLTITDSTMYGYYKFINECKKNDIKPIIGLEIKLEDDLLLGYALNNEGLKNLFKLSNISLKNKLSLDILQEYKLGLYFITPGINSKIYNLFNRNKEDGINLYLEYKSKLKNIGIGIEGKEEFKDIYNYFISNNVSVFPISKTCYLNKDDYNIYEILNKIGNNKYEVGEYYLKTIEELNKEFKEYENVFICLKKFIDYININFYEKNNSLPKYPNKLNVDSKKFLYDLSYKGLNKRLQNKKTNIDIYFKRLEYELDIIDSMGYNDYFLIVWDFIKYAKQNKILVGPGRGSACGSLVAWSLGITSIDPIKYNLLFERFLNPNRITLPDIDTDFPDDKRDDVIKYVRDLYGKKNVCYISTFGTFLIKSSLRELARLFKIDDNRINTIVKIVVDYYEEYQSYEAVLEQFKDNKEVYELVDIARKLEGLPKHVSTHPAGIIISSNNLFDILPLQEGMNDLYQTQLESCDLEDMGLLKIDFLGIRNLSILNDMINYTNEFNNINIYNISLNDKKTFDLLSNGDTTGLFQLESKGITNILKRMSIDKFEDLVSILALYRPGPMDNIDEFILRKNGKTYKLAHDDLIPILKETYGIIVYQEQIMNIALKFAGYSLGEADILRRAVSKKNSDVLINERNKFVDRSIKLGYSSEVANLIYDDIVKFANYGFNKSHSVAYSLLSYVMAYMKANYKKEFIASYLTNNSGDIKSSLEYINYSKRNNILIMPPRINISSDKAVIHKDRIYLPINSIKSISKKVAFDIYQEGIKEKFKSFTDFKYRLNLNSTQLINLINGGYFEYFNQTKKTLHNQAQEEDDVYNKYLKDRIVSNEEYDEVMLKQLESDSLGFNLVYNIFKDIDDYLIKYKAKQIDLSKLDIIQNTIITFDDIKEVMTKNNDIMVVGFIYDSITMIDFVIFPSIYSNIDKIVKNKLYLVSGKIRIDSRLNKEQFVINEIKEIKK